MPRLENPDVRLMVSTFGTDPVVTLSKRTPGVPVGIAGLESALFENRRALHLVSPAWHIEEPDNLSAFARDMSALAARLPDNHVVALVNTEFEAYLLGREGVPTIPASELAFIDEQLYRPLDENQVFAAVYNARFASHKRHELARNVDSLMLLYGMLPGEERRYEEVRRILPNARFMQHEAGGGSYRRLDRDHLVRLINQARVGLCLSPEEGAMRSSMEYQLCGLAVVSTRSRGGRDRYFMGQHCAVVDDDPDAIAHAVRHLAQAGFEKQHIRGYIRRLVSFDRHNFLIAINRLVKSRLGVERMFPSFRPFVGYMTYRTVREAAASLFPSEL